MSVFGFMSHTQINDFTTRSTLCAMFSHGLPALADNSFIFWLITFPFQGIKWPSHLLKKYDRA